MEHLKVAEARARFGEILDQAEKGRTVFIERRGIRFRLVAEPGDTAARAQAPLFDSVDADVMAGQWTWATQAKGVAFTPRRSKRR